MIGKLVQAFQKLQADAALNKRVSEMGAELDIAGPAEFGNIIDADRSRYGKIVTEGKLATQN